MRNGMVFATLTDGRPGRLSQNIYSWIRNASLYAFDEIIIFDNSGNDSEHGDEVDFVINSLLPRIPHTLQNIKVIKTGEEKLPLGKGHDFVFKWLYESDYRYAMFIEDDHFLTDYVPIQKLYNLLDNNPDMVQVSITRNCVYPSEFEANGVLKSWRDLWGNLVELKNKEIGIRYTTRPYQFIFGASMINIEYLNTPMPEGESMWEWHFGERIKEANPNAIFAWVGWIEDLPIACTWLTEDYFEKSFHESLLSDSN